MWKLACQQMSSTQLSRSQRPGYLIWYLTPTATQFYIVYSEYNPQAFILQSCHLNIDINLNLKNILAVLMILSGGTNI